MNSMQALRFFIELIGGMVAGASAIAWVMLYFLRKKVHQKRIDREARENSIRPSREPAVTALTR